MSRNQLVQIRCSPEEKHAWQQLATNKNVKLSSYIRALLNNLAERQKGTS